MERDEIIEKIKKLLRLAESPNEHEALRAASKARELLSAYNISLADLSLDDLSNRLGITEIETEDIIKFEEWNKALAFHVAKIFDCYVIGRGEEMGQFIFLGSVSDAEVAAYTFEFLRRKVDDMAITAARTRREELQGIDEETYRQTYLIGAVQRLREDLVVKTLVFKRREKNECTAVVLHKKENLDNYLKSKYPDIEASESSIYEMDRESFYRGYAQAKGIQINEALKKGI
jgi:hypothetical protein